MSRAIIVKTKKSTFLAEVDDTVVVPSKLQTDDDDTLQGLPRTLQPISDVYGLERDFADIQELIVSCSNDLFEAIKDIPKPEKVTVEFGITLAGEAGFPMLTKASGEASFNVTIEWAPPKV